MQDARIQDIGCGMQVVRCRIWDIGSGMQDMDVGCRIWVWDAGHWMWDAGSGMWDMACRMLDAACGMLDLGCRMQGMACRMRDKECYKYDTGLEMQDMGYTKWDMTWDMGCSPAAGPCGCMSTPWHHVLAVTATVPGGMGSPGSCMILLHEEQEGAQHCPAHPSPAGQSPARMQCRQLPATSTHSRYV